MRASNTVSSEIKRAIDLNLPVVALESTVITHGLPHPQNLSLARDMEAAIRRESATPATIAVLRGEIRVGLSDGDMEELSRMPQAESLKIGPRDFASAMVRKSSGGTTVAATMLIAMQERISIFATGGIGGVHREARFDVSADLEALAHAPRMIVVCAGAKAILDLPATLEYLETMSVPVVGYKTDEFPAFYSRESGLKTSIRLETPDEIVSFAEAHWAAGIGSAILVVNPIPASESIPKRDMDPIIEQASREAVDKKIRGQALTPFLLERVSQLSAGRSMHANLSLLLNNAHLAAQIARARATSARTRNI